MALFKSLKEVKAEREMARKSKQPPVPKAGVSKYHKGGVEWKVTKRKDRSLAADPVEVAKPPPVLHPKDAPAMTASARYVQTFLDIAKPFGAWQCDFATGDLLCTAGELQGLRVTRIDVEDDACWPLLANELCMRRGHVYGDGQYEAYLRHFRNLRGVAVGHSTDPAYLMTATVTVAPSPGMQASAAAQAAYVQSFQQALGGLGNAQNVWGNQLNYPSAIGSIGGPVYHGDSGQIQMMGVPPGTTQHIVTKLEAKLIEREAELADAQEKIAWYEKKYPAARPVPDDFDPFAQQEGENGHAVLSLFGDTPIGSIEICGREEDRDTMRATLWARMEKIRIAHVLATEAGCKLVDEAEAET